MESKIYLPSFIKDFKGIPEEYSKCSVCNKKITNENNNVIDGVSWYKSGFKCNGCKNYDN